MLNKHFVFRHGTVSGGGAALAFIDGSGDLKLNAAGPLFDVADALIYDWRLNGTSIAQLNAPLQDAAAADFSTYNRSGAGIQGAPVHNQSGGGFGGIGFMALDGINDFIDYGNWNWASGAGADNELTIISYVSSFDVDTGVILGQAVADPVAVPFYTWTQFFVGSSDLPHSRIGNLTVNGPIGSMNNDGTWYNLTSTYTGTITTVSIDNAADTNSLVQADTDIANSAVNVTIGARNTPISGIAEIFDGDVAYVTAYDRVLSTQQRTMIWNAGGSPDFSRIAQQEFNSLESWTCEVSIIKGGVVVGKVLSNAVIIP